MDKECGGAYLGRRVDAAAVCSRERFAAHNGTKDKRRHQQHKRPRSGDVGVASEEDSLGASSLASAGVAEADSTMGRRRPLADVQNTSHLGTPEADDTYVMKASSAPKVSALLEELELEGERVVRHACAWIGTRPQGATVLGCCRYPSLRGRFSQTHVVRERIDALRNRARAATRVDRLRYSGEDAVVSGPCAYRLDRAGSPRRVQAGVRAVRDLNGKGGDAASCHGTGMMLRLKCRVLSVVCERCSVSVHAAHVSLAHPAVD
jgi:hypothetical protein